MALSKFIGRKSELARLKGLLDARCASLIVVRGRRRIGKSRLLAEFGKEMKSLFFLACLLFKKPQKNLNEMSFPINWEELNCQVLNLMTGESLLASL